MHDRHPEGKQAGKCERYLQLVIGPRYSERVFCRHGIAVQRLGRRQVRSNNDGRKTDFSGCSDVSLEAHRRKSIAVDKGLVEAQQRARDAAAKVGGGNTLAEQLQKQERASRRSSMTVVKSEEEILREKLAASAAEGALADGERMIHYEDGSYFHGEIKEGTMNGHGKFCYANGGVYDGGWEDGLMHGHGVFTFHDGEWQGDSYDGEWVGGSKHGRCVPPVAPSRRASCPRSSRLALAHIARTLCPSAIVCSWTAVGLPLRCRCRWGLCQPHVSVCRHLCSTHRLSVHAPRTMHHAPPVHAAACITMPTATPSPAHGR